MKLILLALLALLITVISSNPLRRQCECKAVSNTVHFPFHSWDISSCHFCSCKDAAMVNCQEACKKMVESYALTGCGKTVKGSKVLYKWYASSCSSGVGQEEYTCA